LVNSDVEPHKSDVQVIRHLGHETLGDRVVLLLAPKLRGTIQSEKDALRKIRDVVVRMRKENALETYAPS
jgi:hypothetical protein